MFTNDTSMFTHDIVLFFIAYSVSKDFEGTAQLA